MLAVVLVGEWRWRGCWWGCWRGWWVSGGGGCVGGTRGSCFNDVSANVLIFDQNEASRRRSGDPGSPDRVREA